MPRRLPQTGKRGKTPSIQRLMPDSPSPETEQDLQDLFRKPNVFRHLSLIALFLAVMAFDAWLTSVEVRSDGPARQAAVRFTPIYFDPAGFKPLRLVGAWEVNVSDPRFGGISALAMDRGVLVAMTDSGTVIRLPKPGNGGRAFVRDLPGGPGLPQFKVNRDSEALARDPRGRGWWVAFEFWHELWLYDPAFRRSLARVELGEDRWRDNRGIEAMAWDASGLLLFPELGGESLRLAGNRLRSHSLANSYGSLADATRLPDGRLLLITRSFGLRGIAKHLLEARRGGPQMTLHPIAVLDLGARENVEGIAAERRTGGGTRLWLITDNDFRPRKATLLVALDLP